MSISTLINQCFSGIKGTTKENLAYLVEGLIRSDRASVWRAAQAMTTVTGQSFKTNEK